MLAEDTSPGRAYSAHSAWREKVTDSNGLPISMATRHHNA